MHTGGIRNISNELSIRTKIDRSSSNLIEEARRLGLYNNEMASFDFAMVFSNDFSSRPSTSSRHSHGLRLLKEYSANGIVFIILYYYIVLISTPLFVMHKCRNLMLIIVSTKHFDKYQL